MKKFRFLHFIGVLLFLTLNQASFSQVIPQSIADIITKSDCIFEGTVIRSDSYWGVQNRSIYTSHTLQIHKIFKGDMICGTVEIITEGGQVGDIRLEVSHNLELVKGMKGVFACRGVTYNEPPQIDYYPETNSFALEVIYGEQGYIEYFNDSINKAAANLYYSFDSLAQVYDVVELTTQINYTDCEANSIFSQIENSSTHKTHSPNIETYLPIYEEEKQKREAQMRYKKAVCSSNQKLLTSSLTYNFENVTITGVNPRYLAFDIYLNADDNSSYFDNGAVFVQYDTAVFGANVVTNGKILAQRGTIITDVGSYQDPDSLKGDYAPDVFRVILFGRIDASNRYAITTTPTQALHLRLEFKNCNISSNLSFTNLFAMQINSYYAPSPNPLTSACPNFPNIVATDVETTPTCTPTIIDFFPKNLNAGVGDILNISGKYFGATQGSGAIFLKNANNGGLTYTRLDRKDSVLWSDTLIRVYVPSLKDTLTTQFWGIRNTPAGSGLVKVRTNAGLVLTTSSLPQPQLNIRYAYTNFVAQGQKRKVSLVDPYGPQFGGNGGYIFRTKLNNNSRPVVAAAINDWVCLTDVHFRLGDTLPATWTKSQQAYDSVNVIQFGQTQPGFIMQARRWEWLCSGSIDPIVLEIDIIIKDTSIYNFDTTGTVSLLNGQVDFYATILHELGHAHCLSHVNDPTAIMYFG